MSVRTLTSHTDFKVLSSDTRRAILLVAMSEPNKEWYAWELADVIKVPLTRIYYHLNLLTDQGFLTRTVDGVINGIKEKTYRAAQTRIEFRLGRFGDTFNEY